jgi:hypothetical protein
LSGKKFRSVKEQLEKKVQRLLSSRYSMIKDEMEAGLSN